MALGGNEAEMYDIFVSCTPLNEEMMDLRDPELERLQEDAQRIRRHSVDSNISPSPSNMQMVVWGLPAVEPLQQIASGEIIRKRRRTTRIPKRLRLKWHPKKKGKMDPAMKIARKEFSLPSGWAVEVRTRSNGQTAGRKDKYYVAPNGKKYPSLTEVIRALKVVGV